MAIDIGPRIGLDGAAEFNRSIKNIISQSKALAAEMKAVTSAFDQNDGAQSKLTAQMSVLSKQIDVQKQRVQLLGDQYAQASSKAQQLNAELVQAIQKHGQTSTEAAKAARALDQQEASVQKLRTDYLNATAVLNKMNAEFSGLSSEATRVKTPLESLNDTISSQKNELSRLKTEYANAVLEFGKGSSSAKRLSGEIKDLSSDLQTNERRLESATAEADDFGNELQSVGRQASGLGDIIKGSFVGNVLADAFSTITSELGNLGGEALDAADSLTKFESTMDFAGFDSSEIAEVSSAMQDYAARTVYDLETVANTTAQLGANGVANFEQLTEAAGNLNAVAGGNADTFKSVAMVLTQTAGAGKLTTENWNQLADAIPGASGVLQQAMLENGAYVGNFREAMEKGEITAEEFNQAIMQLGFTDAAVQAAESTATIEGALGNLRANITDFITAALTEGGGMELLTTAINGISQAFTDLTANIDWAAFKETVTGAFEEISQFLGDLWNNVLSPMLDFIMNNGELIISIISGIAAGFMAWQVVTGIINAVSAAQAVLNAVMNANPIMLVVTLIAGLVTAFITAYNTSEEFRNTVNAAFEAVRSTISSVVNSIVAFFTQTVPQVFTNFVETTKIKFQALQSAVAFVVDSIVNFFTQTIPNAFLDFVNSAKNAFDNVKETAQNIANNIVNSFNNLLSSIREIAENIGNAVQNGLDNAISFITSLPGKAIQWGRDFINGLADGILEAARGLVNSVRDIAGEISSFLHFSRPDEGPLRQYETWMPDFMSGLAKGINDNAWRVTDALQGVTNQMVFTPQAYSAQPALAGANGNAYSGRPITITINAAAGQSEEYIADLVMRRMQTVTARKEATW